MASEIDLAVLSQGVRTWNDWRFQRLVRSRSILDWPDLRGIEKERSDLAEVNFSETYLTKARLYDCDLRGANFAGALLNSTCLANCDLAKSCFIGASLHGADLHGADLSNAQFTRARLYNANFTGARLDGADFGGAIMETTALGNVDLSEVRGLESVCHGGPSTIGVDTIYKSKGKIPESFLRECGVPDNFVGYIPSLVNSEEGIQFYSCFISYSAQNEDFARRLHGRMRDAHLRVWFAPEDIQAGRKLHEQIETAIRIYDKLLIVLSEASLRSEWVMTELRKARKAERQSGKRKLFPVRLADFATLRDWDCFDADSGTDLAIELREYFIPDFSNWKDHDSFESAFARLLKDLRSS
jgi:hypothetical protein